MDANEIRRAWKARRDAWAEKAKALQAEIIAEQGTLQLPEYRRRLVESGLQAEWAALQKEPGSGPDMVTTGDKRQ